MATEKRLIDANALCYEIDCCSFETSSDYMTVCEQIAEAPTVDAVEVPCKIGDLVWGIKKFNHETERVKQGIVHMMFFGEDMRLCICVKGVCRGEWGKNVFATKEEALAKMDGDGNAR